MRRIVYPLIWLAVTLAAVLIASAAVSNVRDQVTDTPTPMLPPTTIAISSTEELLPDPVQSETSVPLSTGEPTGPTTSSTTTSTMVAIETQTTTTTAPEDSDPEPSGTTTTTTTSAPAASTTTTTAIAPATEIRSYELIGGSVSVEFGDGIVRLAGASPKPGFTMDVEHTGPEKVEVEFRNGSHESKFSGKFEDGGFVPSISEDDEGDD